MKILVTGGAGYIGSHMVKALLEKNHKVVVLDDLSNGHKRSLPGSVPLYTGDIRDESFINDILSKNTFNAAIHFAGVISMGESVQNPSKYFTINTLGAQTLFDKLVKYNIKKVIFSSTAGVYGNPVHVPIPEDDPKNPTNPYGESKLTVEKILNWYEGAYGLKSVCLRYFNAAGASLDGSLGEAHQDETHIIPIAISKALKNEPFKINGNDYNTKDGTCVRDYIHVIDLCEAHLLALEYLDKNNKSNIFNVGTGIGYSNKEIVEMIKKVTGLNLVVEYGQRRPGDADTLIADSKKIQKELRWIPKYSDLETVIKTAFNWHKNNPNGFGD